MDGKLVGYEITPSRVFLATLLFLSAYILLKMARQAMSPLARIKHVSSWPIVRQWPTVMFAKDIKEVVLSWMEHTKEDGIYRFSNVDGSDAVGVFKPEYVKQVLVKNSKIYQRPSYLQRVLPDGKFGILTATGHKHVQQRQILSGIFPNSGVKNYVKKFDEHCMDLVKIWSEECEAGPSGVGTLIVEKDLDRLCLDLTIDIAYGFNFNSVIDKENERANGFKTLVGWNMKQSTMIAKAIIPFYKYLPLKSIQNAEKALSVIKGFLNKIVENKRKTIECNTQKEKEEDLIAALVKIGKDDIDYKMTDDEMKDNMLFFGVGLSAVGTTLTWTLYHLARNLDIQRTARKEALTVIEAGKDISRNDPDRLRYVTAVIKESLRITPPAAFVTRESHEDDWFGDYLVPKGTLVSIPTVGIHNYDKYWTDSDKFMPERFLGKDRKLSAEVTAQTYLPFAQGPLDCLGSNFALMGLKVMLARLLATFHFHISPDHPKVGKEVFVFTKPIPSPTLLLSRVTKAEIQAILEDS